MAVISIVQSLNACHLPFEFSIKVDTCRAMLDLICIDGDEIFLAEVLGLSVGSPQLWLNNHGTLPKEAATVPIKNIN